LRTLIRYEIADGCPLNDDKINFSIPLKGIEFVTPTLKNLFNKFSVRYFLSFGILESDPQMPNQHLEVVSKPYEIVFYK
jgi:hypothetical protein